MPNPPPSPSLLAAVLDSMRGRRIVVVGDAVLDEYLIGRATRLSREAPVPVLELVERSWRPGAGANPAANVAALGGRPVMIGVVGADAAGQRLQAELARAEVDTAGLVVTPDRTTAIKTRILATDPGTRRSFAAYWFLIRPGSSAIRREVLAVVAHRFGR